MEWLKKLSDAIDYIEKNLDSKISYEEAAKIACCSTYYFQRMFSYVAGISLSDYIRRRRMTQAAFELQHTNEKVLDIALKYGYTSSTSFNRGFQNVHGIPPVLAKSHGSVLHAYPPIKFSVQVIGGNSMSYRIEKKASMRIIGIRTPLTEDMEGNMRFVPNFWKEVLRGNQFSEICQMSNQPPGKILGVTAYENPNEIFYYIGTITNKPVPEEMFQLEIPPATWVIFENQGNFEESIQSIFKRFLTEWLPFSGYKYAELPDIEVYPIDNEKSQGGHSEVWIAVKKENEN